jgi:hypothetical protein
MTDAEYIHMHDGTVWFWHDGLKIWTGWVEGEDGVWVLYDEEFRRDYGVFPTNMPQGICWGDYDGDPANY